MHVFDIIGPVMIGPSSSHTAGAARIGRMARRLLDEDVVSADIGLYGSFARTCQGHGTDRALVAGLLDMDVDDPRLRRSLHIAQQKGIAIRFHEIALRDAHPNTACIEATGATRNVVVRAASVGGGAIRVEELNGLPVSFSGQAHTLIVSHQDKPGVIAQTTRVLAQAGINIATMQVFRRHIGGDAVMVMEMDALPDASALDQLARVTDVHRVAFVRKL